MSRPGWVTVLSCALATFVGAATSHAKPNIRQSFFNAYPTAVGSRLDTVPSSANHCGVCHYAFTGAGPRNPYGSAVEAALPGYPNTDSGRQAAIHSIETTDSDGDGYSNLTEITNLTQYSNTPTFPGLTSGNVGLVTGVTLSEITPYLTPGNSSDTQPPTIVVSAPNGGETLTGGATVSVAWAASDNVAVTAVDLDYRDSESAPWTPIARSLANSGNFTWFVHNTPATSARVRATARDAAGNSGTDQSNGTFTILRTPGGIVPATLRDFHAPGTQPFGGGSFQDRTGCVSCHGGYDSAVEPDRNFQGSMMAQAARDPMFYACLTIAEQDAPGSGDMCLRCHTPGGWMSGRSNPTSGAALLPVDLDGVGCDVCHRMVDPVYQAGVSPSEDQAILTALVEVPAGFSNGQYVADPQARKRGPYSDATPPHPFLASPFHRESDLCGTCHDVSNPLFEKVADRKYAPNAMDAPASQTTSQQLMPLERTYSEWKNSSFAVGPGVYAPEFAGNKPGGYVSSCQDCHMRDVIGRGCNNSGAPTRTDLPLHDLTGGNYWMPGIIAQLFPEDVDPVTLAEGAARAVSMLQKAALLDVTVSAEGDSFRAVVTVTNRSGHKLPTGYPEGRRMWLRVEATTLSGTQVFLSGNYQAGTGQLVADPQLTVYEAKLGLSERLADTYPVTAGESFHFALNDTILKDNRVPPIGFSNAAFASFGGQPVDPAQPGIRYADGQNWDARTYRLPRTARKVRATLYYQTTSKEYIEFLRDANTTNSRGLEMYNLWTQNGRAAPVQMAADSAYAPAAGVEQESETVRDPGLLATVRSNPGRGDIVVELVLARPTPVELEIYDLQGRRLAARDLGLLAAGAQEVVWNGRDDAERDLGTGIFFLRVRAGLDVTTRRVIRLR